MRLLVMLLVTTRVALAHPPPPPPEHVDWRDDHALLEWSTWFRAAGGVESAPATDTARATTTPPPMRITGSIWEAALGADVSVGGDHRIGAWAEARGVSPFGGVELVITRAPADLDMFLYHGEGVWIVRAGGGTDRATASLAWGYRCPWRLWGPYSRTTRYEIGARLVVTATRAYHDPDDWSATLGIEVEPVGALRYLLGIRAWY